MVKPTKPTKRPAKVKTAADLAAPVWANPDDDDLRQVVADAMQECGDPWGELITLQLQKRGTAKQRARIEELLDSHGATALGPIAKIALAWRFQRGFPDAIQLICRAAPRKDWQAALEAPHWATVRHLAIDNTHTPKWWITAWVANPANRALKFEIGTLATSSLSIQREPGKPWQIQLDRRNSARAFQPVVKAFVAGLPPGQTLTLSPAIQDPEVYAAALKR